MKVEELLRNIGADDVSIFSDKVLALDVVKKIDGCKVAFPQNQKRFTYRNVMNWWLLSDGSALGWNESPRSGWGFPRVARGSVDKFYEAYPHYKKMVDAIPELKD